MKIKVFRINKDIDLPKVIKKGDWVDLSTSSSINLHAPFAHMLKKKTTEGSVERRRNVEFYNAMIPLGVAMQLPEGFEAILAPRSSSFKKWGIMQVNSFGVIDETFSSEKDEWKMPVIAFKETAIPKGERICQFRIQPSQKASAWQKLKWLFSNGIEIEETDHLDNETRGGFGSSDKLKTESNDKETIE